MVRIFAGFIVLFFCVASAQAEDTHQDEMFSEYPAEFESAELIPTFAGYYAVEYDGCGTECVEVILVDVRTGERYQVENAPYGASYTLESNLFVTDSCPVDPPPPWLKQRFFVWNESDKRLEPLMEAPPNTYHFYNTEGC